MRAANAPRSPRTSRSNDCEPILGVHPPAELLPPPFRAHDSDPAGDFSSLRFRCPRASRHGKPLGGYRVTVLEPRESDVARRYRVPLAEHTRHERSRAPRLAHQKPVMRTLASGLEPERLVHPEVARLGSQPPGHRRIGVRPGKLFEGNEAPEPFLFARIRHQPARRPGSTLDTHPRHARRPASRDVIHAPFPSREDT